MDQDLKQQKSGLQTKGNQQPFRPIGHQRPYENAMISSIQTSINSDFLEQLDCDQRLNQLLIQLKYNKDYSIQFAFMMLDDYKCEKMVVNERNINSDIIRDIKETLEEDEQNLKTITFKIVLAQNSIHLKSQIESNQVQRHYHSWLKGILFMENNSLFTFLKKLNYGRKLFKLNVIKSSLTGYLLILLREIFHFV